MNKTEVKKILKQRRKEGYVTFEEILDIYDDNEKLPKDILDLVAQKIECREICIDINEAGMQAFHKAIQKAAQQYLK